MRFNVLNICCFLLLTLVSACFSTGRDSIANIQEYHRTPPIEPNNTGIFDDSNVITNPEIELARQHQVEMMFFTYSEVTNNQQPDRIFVEYYKNSTYISPYIKDVQLDKYDMFGNATMAPVLDTRVFIISGIEKSSTIYAYRSEYLKNYRIIGETAYYSKTPITPELIRSFIANKRGNTALLRTYYDNGLSLYFIELGVAVKTTNTPNPWDTTYPESIPTNIPSNVDERGGPLIAISGLYKDTHSGEIIYIRRERDRTDRTRILITGYITELVSNDVSINMPQQDAVGKVRFIINDRTKGGFYFNESRMPMPAILSAEMQKGYLRVLLPNKEIRYLASIYLPASANVPPYSPPQFWTSYPDSDSVGPMSYMAFIPVAILILIAFL